MNNNKKRKQPKTIWDFLRECPLVYLILISVIALLCMLFFGVNLFLQGKGIMFLLIPIAMAIFIFYGYFNSTRK